MMSERKQSLTRLSAKEPLKNLTLAGSNIEFGQAIILALVIFLPQVFCFIWQPFIPDFNQIQGSQWWRSVDDFVKQPHPVHRQLSWWN